MSLMDKLKKNSTIKESETVSKSKFFNKKDVIPTLIPAINIALSGSVDGGLTPGLTVFAGASKNFKSGFSLLMAKAYMDKYPDSVMLFYDSEFGTPKTYFDSFKIDMDRVLHSPIVNLEQLRSDIMTQLEGFVRGDRVVIVVDSLGNSASKKEINDALEEKSVADFTRAKTGKSLFRMVTPYLNLLDIPMVAVAHTYDTMEMFSKAVVSGGKGIYYAADNIFIIGRQQEKDKDGVIGYNFVINVEKSRFVKEKSKIIIEATFNEGVNRWSGLLDMATESGHIAKVKIGNSTGYSIIDRVTGEVSEEKIKTKATYCEEFWNPILNDADFRKFVEDKYKLGAIKILSNAEIEEEIDDVTGEDDE